MRIVRLDQNDLSSWALFPFFERRCVNFAESLLRFTKEQVTALEGDLRTRFVQAGGALFLAAIDDDKRMTGHMVGWVNWNYGVPYFFVWQAENDVPTGDEGVESVLHEIDQFIVWANSMYEKAGQVARITQVKTETRIKQESFKRYFEKHGIRVLAERTVMYWEV